MKYKNYERREKSFPSVQTNSILLMSDDEIIETLNTINEINLWDD